MFLSDFYIGQPFSTSFHLTPTSFIFCFNLDHPPPPPPSNQSYYSDDCHRGSHCNTGHILTYSLTNTISPLSFFPRDEGEVITSFFTYARCNKEEPYLASLMSTMVGSDLPEFPLAHAVGLDLHSSTRTSPCMMTGRKERRLAGASICER